MATDEKLTTVAEKSDNAIAATFQASSDGLKLFVTLKRLPPTKPAEPPAKTESGTAGENQPEAAAALPPVPEPPPADQPITADQIRALIGDLAEKTLLHEEIIEALANELMHPPKGAPPDKPLERRRIAKGRAAVPGKDGKLLFLVKKFEQKNAKLPPEIVDPRFIHFFDNIEAKAIVGRLYPPAPGVDGVAYDGKPITAPPGNSFEPKLDASVSLTPAGAGRSYQELVAEQAGYLTEEGGLLMVKNELVIGGDLDFRFGDIDFVGSVKIKGSVQKDFTVTARGNIEISGDVNQARLHSKQGAITVTGSVIGERTQSLQVTEATSHQAMNEQMKNRGFDLCAATSITASRVENAVIEAGSDVTIKRELKTCCLRTRTNLFIPEGQIVGGDTYAVCGVEAGTIGTDAGTTTKIFAISDIESSGEYVAIETQLRSHQAAEEMIKLYLGPYLKMPNRVARLNPDYRRKIEDLLRKLKGVESAKTKLTEELDKLLANASQSSVYRVNFKKIAYPGLIIFAEEEKFEVGAEIKGPATIEFIGSEKRFSTGELKPLTCELEKRPMGKRPAKR